MRTFIRCRVFVTVLLVAVAFGAVTIRQNNTRQLLATGDFAMKCGEKTVIASNYHRFITVLLETALKVCCLFTNLKSSNINAKLQIKLVVELLQDYVATVRLALT